MGDTEGLPHHGELGVFQWKDMSGGGLEAGLMSGLSADDNGLEAALTRATVANPASSGAALSDRDRVEHIEDRGVSAAFLRHFAASKLTDEMAREATATAIGHLQGKVERTRRQRDDETQRHQEAKSICFDSVRKFNRILKRDRRDLSQRRAAPHMTCRDVHRLVVKPSTDEKMLSYVELDGVLDGVDASSGMPWVARADYFFSYSWDSPFEEVLDSLSAHTEREIADGRRTPYYSVDMFGTNQHTRADTDR